MTCALWDHLDQILQFNAKFYTNFHSRSFQIVSYRHCFESNTDVTANFTFIELSCSNTIWLLVMFQSVSTVRTMVSFTIGVRKLFVYACFGSSRTEKFSNRVCNALGTHPAFVTLVLDDSRHFNGCRHVCPMQSFWGRFWGSC